MKKLAVLLVTTIVAGVLLYEALIPRPVYLAEKIKQFQKPQEMEVAPLLFTGDIMLGRYVETLQKTTGLDPFGDTTKLLKSHITISNLEGPIPEINKPTPINNFTFSFPSSTPAYLKDHGVRAVSLASNHSLDQGVDGYEHTKLALDGEGIFHFGGYGTTVPDYFETKLGTTTVLVYGINMISSTWDEQVAKNTTNLLRKNHPEAYLVAFVHWGNEYDLKQGYAQQAFARKLIDEGVNAIVGSHPHVTQGIEMYKNSPIFYSLGNFIFDQYFSVYTQRGYMLSMDKKDDQFIFTMIPVVSSRSKAAIADNESKNIILETVAKSSELNLRESIRRGYLFVPIL